MARRFERRQARRVLTLISLTILSVLASASAALADSNGWLW